MNEYNALKDAIRAAIKPNGEYALTAQVLQNILIAIVNSFGKGYQFMGIATADTEPGEPDEKEFYVGFAGEYANFVSETVTVPVGGVVIFLYDTEWHANVVKVAERVAVSGNHLEIDGARSIIEQDVVNVNTLTSQGEAFLTAAAARAAVSAESGLRIGGQVITYLVETDEEHHTAWVVDQFTGDDAEGWENDDNWQPFLYVELAKIVSNQAQINEAVMEALSNRYTKEQIDGMIEPLSERMGAAEEGLAAEILRAQAAESRLQDIYEGLTQNSVIVGPLPSSGQADTIYRVPGTSSYSDYMWNGTQFVLMATYSDGRLDFINVNLLNATGSTPHAAYATADAARADISAASGLRALGLQVTYLLTDGVWYTDQYIGTDISGWSTASNWQALGPVRVTQNTNTGGEELNIGGTKIGNIDDMFNVNIWTDSTTPFERRAYARYNVPIKKRKRGLVITYLYLDEWYTEMFIGTDVSQWTYDENWKWVKNIIKLEGLGTEWADVKTTGWEVGQIMFNTTNNVLRRVQQVTEQGGVALWAHENPPLDIETLYVSDGKIYLYNGTMLVLSDNYLVELLNTTNTKIDKNFDDIQDSFKPLTRQLVLSGLTEVSHETGVLKTDGTIAPGFTAWVTRKYNVENEPLVFVNGRQANASGYMLAALYDANNQLISIFSAKQSGEVLYFPIISAGAKYLKVSSDESYTAAKANVIANGDLSRINEIPYIQKTLEEIANDHAGNDLEYIEYVNAIIKSDGTLQDVDGTYWKLYKYDVSNQRIVFVTGRAASTCAVAAFYDANDNPISVINYGTSTNYIDLCLYVPYNAKYLRVNQFLQSSLGLNYPNAKDYSVWSIYQRNNLKGQVVAFIGDSITAGGTETAPADKLYHKIFADKYGCTNRNLGVWGTCIANNTKNTDKVANRFVTRATAQNLSDCSLIVVFGGTNDFTYDSKPIGDCLVEVSQTPTSEYMGNKKLVAPSDTDTFAGAVHELINTIRTVAPTVPILFMTPLKKHYGANSSIQVNAEGNYLQDFTNAIKTICEFYAIPVFDCGSMSELDFMNDAIATEYSNDGLHPNIAGHKILGELLFRFVEDNICIGLP